MQRTPYYKITVIKFFCRREANLTSLSLALVPIFDVLSQQIEVLPLGVPEKWSEEECKTNSVNEEPESFNLNDSTGEHVPDGAFCMTWPVFLLGSMIFSIVNFLLHTKNDHYLDVVHDWRLAYNRNDETRKVSRRSSSINFPLFEYRFID